MEMSFRLVKLALALASATLLQLSAHAQTADSAQVEIAGQISATTCNLSISDSSSQTGASTKTLDLGTNLIGSGPFVAGQTFGTSKRVFFKLTDPASTQPCNASATTTWNVILGFAPGSIGTLTDGRTFVKNQATSNATDAWMQLIGNTGSPMVLKETMGYLGSAVAFAGHRIIDNTSMALVAQLVYSSNQAPEPGAFTATIPLLVLYK